MMGKAQFWVSLIVNAWAVIIISVCVYELWREARK